MPVTYDFSSHVAVVTGASRGIGAACAEALAEAGARVILVARSADALDDLAARLPNRPVVVPCDLADSASIDLVVDAVVEAGGRLGVLVNNAGIALPEPPDEISPSALDQQLTINLRNLLLLTSRLAEPLIAAGGNVVNISSIAGNGGGPNQAVYSATKGAVDSLSRNLAREWGPKGVRVNAVAPGLIVTDIWADVFQEHGEDEVRSELGQMVPLQRWGTPEEVAAAVIWLASDGASYVNGQVLRVCGGVR